MFWYLWKTVKILNIKPDSYILMIMDKIPSIPPNPKLLTLYGSIFYLLRNIFLIMFIGLLIPPMWVKMKFVFTANPL